MNSDLFKNIINLVILILILTSACTTFKADDDTILFNDQPLYPGQTERFGSEYQTQFRKLSVDDTTRLQTAWIYKKKASNTVLYFGGNGFRIGIQGHEKASPYTKLGYNVLLFDYRGYGWSEGKSDMEKLKRDALTVYDSLLVKHNIEQENLILHGHSVGSLIAAHVAQQREPEALVLESSITTMQEWWKEVTPWFLRLFIKFEAGNGLKGEGNSRRVIELQLPIFFIGGSSDPITPSELTRRLFKQSATSKEWKELYIFEGADHNSIMQHPEFQEKIRQFVDNLK